jgi:hypothetical protein
LIIWLCTKYEPAIFDFASSIKFTEVKIIIDDNSFQIQNNNHLKYIIQIPEEDCIHSGYQNSNANTHINKKVIAWDKALFYLGIRKPKKVIILENDVFVPDQSILHRLFTLEYDLLIREHNFRFDSLPNWHWVNIEKYLVKPHYYSMACFVGLSLNMIELITQFVKNNKTLVHIEALFNSLAHQNSLRILTPKELLPVVAMGKWDLTLIKLFPDKLYHPVKNTTLHGLYRKHITSKDGFCNWVNIEAFMPTPYQHNIIPRFIRE